MSEDDADIDDSRPRERRNGDSRSWTHPVDWETVATDPPPGSLEYEISQWERIPVTDNDQIIFLPGNEEDLANDAFIVLEEADLCDLVTHR